MSAEEEPKEWFKVTHAANGVTSVTCSRMEGNHSVKWTVKTYPTSIKPAVAEARRYAIKALEDLKSAIRELDAA